MNCQLVGLFGVCHHMSVNLCTTKIFRKSRTQVEDYLVLRCGAVLQGFGFATFRKDAVPSSCRPDGSKNILLGDLTVPKSTLLADLTVPRSILLAELVVPKSIILAELTVPKSILLADRCPQRNLCETLKSSNLESK